MLRKVEPLVDLVLLDDASVQRGLLPLVLLEEPVYVVDLGRIFVAVDLLDSQPDLLYRERRGAALGFLIVIAAVVDLEALTLRRCGDKGLSVGEKSKANLKNILITESKIGVASKDSSVTTIDQISMNKLETCLSAFKKKKEFSGSTMKVKRFSCNNFYKKIDKDNLSDIFVENEI